MKNITNMEVLNRYVRLENFGIYRCVYPYLNLTKALMSITFSIIHFLIIQEN